MRCSELSPKKPNYMYYGTWSRFGRGEKKQYPTQTLLVRTKKLSKCFQNARKVSTCKPWFPACLASGPSNGVQWICFWYSSKVSENGVLRYSRRSISATGKCSTAARATNGRVTYTAVTWARNCQGSLLVANKHQPKNTQLHSEWKT